MKNTHQLFLKFLIAWFLLNLFQVIFTGIHADEAYYAIWGKNLDWGYFDHPPAVAVLTYLGSLFFEGNLGVRFFTLLLHLGTVSCLWFSIDEKYRKEKNSVYLFFIVLASLTMLSVYAFTTTPDAPLVFFIALFLLGYKKFLDKESWWLVIVVAISVAGMLYSKYHGVLFVGLVVLSNLRLLLNIKVWVAGILALFLLIPHLYWQYSHDFSSFKFHLVARSLGFQIKYVLEFIPGQLGVFNPFTLGGVVFVLWKTKYKGSFERTLYFLIIGIIGFFALSTYRGRAEAHWTAMASLPMLILLTIRAVELENIKKYVLRYIAGSLVLVFVARGILLTSYAKKFGYVDLEATYKTIEKIAGNTPVVFNSSFQDPALYEFYTQKPTTTISSMETRQTQYDFWQKEQIFLGKKVLLVNVQGFEKYKIADEFVGDFVEDWQIPNRLQIHYNLGKNMLKRGKIVEVPIEIENPTEHSIDFQYQRFPINLKVVFLVLKRDYVVEDAAFSEELKIIQSKQKIKGVLRFKVPELLQEREYKFSVITFSPFGHTLNSSFQNIEIK